MRLCLDVTARCIGVGTGLAHRELNAERVDSCIVGDCKQSFGGSPEAAKTEFCKQRPLVDLLEESGAQGVGNLKDGAQHAPGQRIQLNFIGVDWRLSAARIDVAS